MIREAEGQAEAILKVQQANADGLRFLKEAAPDMIAITGDLIDSRSTDVEVALQFAQEAVKIATCYYVTGNHEARVAEYVDLKKGLLEQGVIVLEDQRVELEHSGATIWLLGIDDPSFETDYLLGDAEAVADRKLKQLMPDEDGFSVLLSHRPELFEVYWRYDVDLILTGHAHGGQFRFPFVGGLVAPNQGIFPDYDAGTYTEGHTHMIVSRGIGNSIIPIRFNNRPEVLLIELQSVSE